MIVSSETHTPFSSKPNRTYFVDGFRVTDWVVSDITAVVSLVSTETGDLETEITP